MEVNILFIGDIVGRPGRHLVYQLLPDLYRKYTLDAVIANAENAAGGLGITPKIAEELLNSGIHLLTSGNHVWRKREILPYLEKNDRLLRPENYPSGVPGKGVAIVSLNSGIKMGVLNLEGRTFMKPLDCPFRTALTAIEIIRKETPFIIVDFHAEATSEKVAMGWFLDGKVSAVLGTHTHVPTADETILPQGTAYITDVGMTGALISVIGMRVDVSLRGLLTQLPQSFKPASEKACLQGVILTVDASSGKAKRIKRIRDGNGY